ncbi:N-acylethanolamine-hydrolyzing acid amidase isoform X2 [Hydra vulgaris]|uniref:N-acylethanolamine-hydrolyzing acid amidase n=1 Tax=Hydra vulgaris TaxID=6087 RepID=A0ABM4DET8_HYDVU
MLSFQLCFMLLATLGNISTSSCNENVPTYILDLETKPELRWFEITKKYSQFADAIRNVIQKMIPTRYIKLVETAINIFHLENYFPKEYASELVGVANGLNLTLPEVFLVNVLYEAGALCTSIVAKNENGTIFHGRNLDYELFTVQILKNLTANIEFMHKGNLIYKSTTFIGQVGFFTVMKPNKFTVTLNQRLNSNKLIVFLEAILDRKAKTAAILMREVVDLASSYSEAVSMLSEAHLIARLYFIVGGIASNEGVIITRGQYYFKEMYYLNDTEYGWFLVQTNYDHWLNPPPWDDRRHPAIQHLLKIGFEQFSLHGMNEVLSTPPVFNNDTIYTTLMSAKYPEYYFSYKHN